MKTTRGVSQVVFNLLPEQTLDVGGRVWKVARWPEPRVLPVDLDVVRSELRRISHAWTAAGLDGGFADRLGADELRVIAPSEDGGVRVDPFPELWYCRRCRRLETSTEQSCRCGTRQWVQLAFVAYHDCGRMETPWVPRCKEHGQVRVNLPGSSSTADLSFDCPECGQSVVASGFPFRKCPCGDGTFSYNLHRAAVVYTPRSTVIVNPPSAEEAAALKTESGSRRALEWVLSGMQEEKPLDGGLTVEGLVAKMVAEGVPEEVARIAAKTAAEQGEGVASSASSAPIALDPPQLEAATRTALRVAYATGSGRTLVDDLAERAGEVQLPRYEVDYPAAIADAHLEGVELLEDFPVLNACYGYTRGGNSGAGESTLRWFRTSSGAPRIHGHLSRTEALLFRLDPIRVVEWLNSRGHALGGEPLDGREARLQVLAAATVPTAGEDPALDTAGADLLRLVHSYSHRVMRRIASFAGIDRDSLSEYLIPEQLSFIVYAAARGDFVLGGLQGLFEQDLATAIADVRSGEHRCPLDPGCSAHGGACVACLHVGEPSCRVFNQFLDRRVLFGPGGYLTR